MRKYYIISILLLSIVSQIYPQNFELQEFEFQNPPSLSELTPSYKEGYLHITTTRQTWDSALSIWINDSLYEFSYNNIGLIDTIIAHKWRNGIVWGNDGRWTYAYNENNSLVEKYFATWFTTYWWNYARYLYTYYGNNLLRAVLQFWSGINWDNMMRLTYHRNSYDQITMILTEVTTEYGPGWCNRWKIEYTYDSENRLTKIIEFETYCGSSWDLHNQTLLYYDDSDNNTEKISQVWNSQDSTWVNDFLYRYEYDNNNFLIRTIYEDWDVTNLGWINVWEETYTYTPQNKFETILKETWVNETKWGNYTFRMISYDGNDNWIENLTQIWDSTHWVNHFRHLATWEVPVSVEDELVIVKSYKLYQNFPNPFNPSTSIQYAISSRQFVSLKVYDVLGNEIATLVNEEKPAGSYEIEFDATGLPSGIYLYRLTAGKFRDVKKLMLIK